MKDTGAIIVTWNSEAEIGPCLDAVLPRVDEVVVVDNGSQDRTREEVARRSGVRLLANPTNRGFAAAVNQGFRALPSPFALLLNPDAILLTEIDPLVEACRHAGVGAAAGKLVDELGGTQVGFNLRRFPTAGWLGLEVLGLNRLWPGNPIHRRYRCLDLDHDIAGDVEQPAGAFLVVSREAWQAVGGFDEEFQPLWFEDVDFLKRLKDAGFRVVYEPAATARHSGGHSVRKIDPGSRTICWYSSLLRYVSKHLGAYQARTVCALAIIGSVPRMLVAVLAERRLRCVGVYSEVIRLACRRLASRREGRAGGAPALARR